jgi:hypothetical protein
MVAMEEIRLCASRVQRLTVGVEAVDAVLDLGEDATGGIRLANSNNRRYHLRNVEKMSCGAVYGEIQASQTARYRFIRWED